MLLRNRFINTTALCLEGEGVTPPGGPPANAPAPLAAPWGADVNKPWMLGDAAAPKPWFETLTDGPTKEFVKSKNYANPAVMADALFSANRMVNGNAVELPGQDAAPDAYAAFAAKLRGEGVKAATDYRFTFGKDAEGKDLTADPALVGFAQSLAYDLGVPPKRAQELIVDKWQQFAKTTNEKAHADSVAANAAEAETVKTKWGANFDTFLAAGQRAAKSLGLDAAELAKIEGAIGAAPMMNLFALLGQKSAEGGLPSGDPSRAADPSNMTPQAAQAEAERMRADPAINKILMDKTDPQHANMVAKLEQLHATMAGVKKPA